MSTTAHARVERLLQQLELLSPPGPGPLLQAWTALRSARSQQLPDGVRDALDEAEARLSLQVRLVSPAPPWKMPVVVQGAAPVSARVPVWKGQPEQEALQLVANERADRLALTWTEAVDAPGVAHPWEPGTYWRALVARLTLGTWLEVPGAFPDAARRRAVLVEGDAQLLAQGRVIEHPVIGYLDARLEPSLVDRQRFGVLWRTPRGFRMPGTLVLRQ